MGDGVVGSLVDEDLARVRFAAEAGGEVHDGAEGGVVAPALEADGAEGGVAVGHADAIAEPVPAREERLNRRGEGEG